MPTRSVYWRDVDGACLVELWLAITFGAAFLQNVRSLLQKRLTGDLSVNGATYVRFIYALPFAWVYALWMWDGQLGEINVSFFLYVLTGAVAQIIATACLLSSFTTGNFAVGTAFSKTEAAQAALFGLIVLGDSINVWVVVGIFVSLCGVILLSGQFSWRDLLRPNRALWLGLAAGAGFALSAIGFRGASLSLDAGTFAQRAALTVVASVTLQTLIMGSYLHLREPGQIAKVLRSWRAAVWVGAIGMIASAGWFTAMTLKNAAVVRAVGQVELLFTIVTSVWLLRERLHLREVAGMILVLAGIWLLI
jgi:drug/metabolite transporter (DMT)-like permease